MNRLVYPNLLRKSLSGRAFESKDVNQTYIGSVGAIRARQVALRSARAWISSRLFLGRSIVRRSDGRNPFCISSALLLYPVMGSTGLTVKSAESLDTIEIWTKVLCNSLKARLCVPMFGGRRRSWDFVVSDLER